MKIFLPAVAGVLAIAFAQPSLAQSQTPCDAKGIFTDPARPAVNPEYSARTNTFNWYVGQQNSGMAWSLNNVAINEPDIQMPWWQTDNAPITHLQGKLDLPKDGWELMKRDLGFNDAGTPVTGSRNPYVIMYNKRTGMLRVFTAIGDLFNSYQFAEIKLTFNSNGATRKAATLNRMEGIGTALLDTPPGLTGEFVSVARFLNYKSKWFMADFPMEYDPCACQFDSKLQIEVRLIGQADVKLTAVTTGTLISTDKTNPSATQTSSDFDQAFNTAKKAANNVSKASKTYKSLDSWASGVKKSLTEVGTVSSTADADKKKNAVDALKAAMAKSDFLKNGLSALPYIGFAVSAFDAFFGGGKEESGSQPVALQPMTIEMTTQTTGTITTDNLYSNPTFNNPGTRTITTALDYPYYNEAMGVFSLLTRPTVEYRNTIFTDVNGVSSRRFQFKVPTQLQYVINPASGLEVQDFQVALVQNANVYYPELLPFGWEYEGLAAQASGSSRHAFRTPYVNSGCLTGNMFTLETKDPKFQEASEVVISPSSSTTFLKFILNLRRPGAPATEQNTLIVLKYPVTTRLVSQFTNTSGLPCVPVQAQMAAADVQTLCMGSVYQAAVTLRTTGPKTSTANPSPRNAVSTVSYVQVYPNPAVNAATIRFAGTAGGRASAYLTDLYGNRTLTIMQNEVIGIGEQLKTFATTSLKPGLYQCVVETPDGKRISTRFSVNR